MTNRKLLVALFALCLLANTIELGAQTKHRRPRNRTPKVAPAAVTTPSGLTYLITKKGTGRQPKTGETVVIHYTGMLTNGVKFDSSRDRSGPFAFKLGVGQVIKGWDEGVAKLRVGDQAILAIPSDLAYGSKGAGDDIPPTSHALPRGRVRHRCARAARRRGPRRAAGAHARRARRPDAHDEEAALRLPRRPLPCRAARARGRRHATEEAGAPLAGNEGAGPAPGRPGAAARQPRPAGCGSGRVR